MQLIKNKLLFKIKNTTALYPRQIYNIIIENQVHGCFFVFLKQMLISYYGKLTT